MNCRTEYLLAAISAAILNGCSAPQSRTAVTSDQVLAAQYHAGSSHGAIGGAETAIITDSYRRNISAAPADKNTELPNAH